MDLKQKIAEAYGRNRGYAQGFASPTAPSLGGRRQREDDEYHVPDPVAKDEPHAVHVNGKKWKSFGSKSHAQNVAKKIAGATVHKEEVEVQEVNDYFKRRQREKDIDAGKPVKRQPKNPQNDYFARRKKEKDLAEGTLDEAVGMMIKGAVISGANDQDIADRIAAKTGGRVDSGSYGHHVLITYPTTQHRAEAAVKIRKMFPGIKLYKSGGNRNAIDEQGVAEAKDSREYDYEGDMAKSQLRAIIANAQRAHDMLEDTTNMAEWVQSKITLAADYISTVADYMQSEVKEESEVAEASKRGLWDNIHAKRKRGEAPAKPGDKDYPKTLNIEAMGLKEEEMDTRIWEAWSMGKRDPQRGIKVGQQVRSYDFPGMHDDHYIDGHVVGETPHSYQIRTNRVVRAGKDVPIPAHMSHIEAPKGRGMFSGAYGVHKILAKQNSVAAQVQPAQGAAKTFSAVRGKR